MFGRASRLGRAAATLFKGYLNLHLALHKMQARICTL
jgi:hypothetical protein